MDTGKLIAQLRKSRGLNQEQLASALKVSSSTIAMWETNKRALKDETIRQLADFFNISTDYLLGRETPEWATNQDIVDIEKAIKDNVPMNYDGIELDEEDRAQIDRVIRAVMWEKLEARKKEKNDEQK